MVVLVLLIILAAVAGILWQVLEVALWLVLLVGIAAAVAIVASYVWFRKRYRRID